MYEFVMLVPGKDEQETFEGLLSSRRPGLGIYSVNYKIYVHPRRDPGCFNEAPEFLQPYKNIALYSMVVLDYEGSGQENRSPLEVKNDLKKRLETSGWMGRTEVLVLCPELEIWIWSDSPEVDRILGWKCEDGSLRDWLINKGWWQQGSEKPDKPKECFEEVLRKLRIRRSSAIYKQLAETVGLERCRDDCFHTFKQTMRKWFPSA
jgi:hypothetical protein